MATYYNQVEEEIKKGEGELAHLNEELAKLRDAERNMPFASYQREHANILEHISRQEQQIARNEAMLKSYDAAFNSLTDLRRLNGYLATERDPQTRREINEEIEAKSQELASSRANLTADLLNELQQEVINNQNTTVTERVDNSSNEVEIINNPNTAETEMVNNPSNEVSESINTPAPSTSVDTANEQIDNNQTQLSNTDEARQDITSDIDEFIPGTNIRKPRTRDPYESDNDYVSYLRNYYDKHFGHNQSNKAIDQIDKMQIDPQVKKEGEPNQTSITPSDKGNIINNTSDGPRKIANNNPQQTKNPTPAPKDMPLGLPEKVPRDGPTGIIPVDPNAPKGIVPVDPNEPKGMVPVDKKPHPTKEKPPKKQEPVKPKRGLITIIEELTDGLDITRKDGKRYRASNIKVSDTFKKELRSGNFWYNVVHVVPALIKTPIQLFRKLAGKTVFRKSAQERMEVLRERIANLPEEDLMTIYNEYRAGRVNQERFPSALNTLLDERMQQFTMEKVGAINTELEAQYNSVFGAIKQLEAIDEQLANPNLSNDQRTKLTSYRQKLLKGRAKQIESIRNNYIEANQWLSGGAHGFSEDMKAAATKLSCVGKRFAKDHDLDLELLKKEAALERAENQAIADGNDEMALRTFVQAESLLSANTEIKNSVFGKRSTGKKYYSPLAEQLDYRDDPFIKDLFTTIAVTGAAVSAVNALRVHGQESDQIVAEQQAEAARINNANDQTIAGVHQAGTDIVGKRGTMMEGMQAQSQHDVLNAANEVERGVLDKTDWGLGTSDYRKFDSQGHEFYNDFYSNTQAALQNVTRQYGAGQITQQQAMDMINNINATTQGTLNNVTSQCLQIAQNYASTHPQFDLTAVTEAMSYITQHPDAIANMNQAMVDVTNIGDQLTGLTVEHVQALQSLPSDLQTTLFGAATAGALAYKVSTTMNGYERRGKYGNEVTNMVSDYVNSQTEPVEENSRNK